MAKTYCKLCGRKTRGLIGVCKGHSYKQHRFDLTPKELSANKRNAAKRVHNIICVKCKGKGCLSCHFVGKVLRRDGE